MHGPHKLPEARLQPKDGADRLQILRGRVRDGARTTGKVAGVAAKTLAMIALCGAGLFAIGSSRTRTSYDFDKRLENLQRMNESTMRMLNQPKIDWENYNRTMQALQPKIDDNRIYRNLDALKARHLDEGLLMGRDAPKPTRATSPAVSSQPPSAQQRATQSP